MEVRVFQEPVAFQLGPIPVTETMLTSLAVSCMLLAAALGCRWLIRDRPRHLLSVLAAALVRAVDKLVTDILGRPQAGLSNFAGALFLFILCCNVAGHLPGLRPATGSLATTSALAVIVFLAIPLAGIRSRGVWPYIQHYFQPNPLLFPLHVISELARTVALSLRLFGNIMSGQVIVALIIALAGFPVAMPFLALDLLIGVLQAYIFTVLAVVYISAALGEEEESWTRKPSSR